MALVQEVKTEKAMGDNYEGAKNYDFAAEKGLRLDLLPTSTWLGIPDARKLIDEGMIDTTSCVRTVLFSYPFHAMPFELPDFVGTDLPSPMIWRIPH